MSKTDKAFGFYPKHLLVDTGSIRIRPRPELDQAVESVVGSDWIDNGWIYAPPQEVFGFMSGEIRERPFSSRVFGLPKTHTFEHAKATGEDHLQFHIWALSFFLGMRLTTMERGFLDATPVETGRLVDFVLLGASLERAIDLAEAFWMTNHAEPRNAKRFAAAVHALFLGQYPQALQFERFLLLYTATDACYALTEALRRPTKRPNHGERIAWMCGELGLDTPTWARSTGKFGTAVSAIRNDAFHEALFMDEPLGFAIHGGGTSGNLTREMTALVCRLLVALIGGRDTSYLASRVNTRQRHGLRLS